MRYNNYGTKYRKKKTNEINFKYNIFREMEPRPYIMRLSRYLMWKLGDENKYYEDVKKLMTEQPFKDSVAQIANMIINKFVNELNFNWKGLMGMGFLWSVAPDCDDMKISKIYEHNKEIIQKVLECDDEDALKISCEKVLFYHTILMDDIFNMIYLLNNFKNDLREFLGDIKVAVLDKFFDFAQRVERKIPDESKVISDICDGMYKNTKSPRNSPSPITVDEIIRKVKTFVFTPREYDNPDMQKGYREIGPGVKIKMIYPKYESEEEKQSEVIRILQKCLDDGDLRERNPHWFDENENEFKDKIEALKCRKERNAWFNPGYVY